MFILDVIKNEKKYKILKYEDTYKDHLSSANL